MHKKREHSKGLIEAESVSISDGRRSIINTLLFADRNTIDLLVTLIKVIFDC